jgi:transposase
MISQCSSSLLHRIAQRVNLARTVGGADRHATEHALKRFEHSSHSCALVSMARLVRKLEKGIPLSQGPQYYRRMAYIEGHSREQMLLLPASVDYVAADNPVRFIAAFVEDLDLGEAGFIRSRPEATGRPGYDPGDLLKLYLYGYLNRVRSSRRLAAEAARNLEVLWLLRGLQPDFRTIADFRCDNRNAFKAVFRSFVLLCRQLDLFGRELLAVDGTRLKAVNSRRRNFTRNKLAEWIKHADERIDEYLSHLNRVDQTESEGSAARAVTLEAKIARM